MSSSDYEGCSLFPCLSSPKKKRRNASPSTSSTSLDQSSEAIRLSKNQLQHSLINSQEHELENIKTREQLAIDKWEHILQQEKLEKRRPSINNSPDSKQKCSSTIPGSSGGHRKTRSSCSSKTGNASRSATSDCEGAFNNQKDKKNAAQRQRQIDQMAALLAYTNQQPAKKAKPSSKDQDIM